MESYGSTAIVNLYCFQRRDRLLTSESDVYKRQILTCTVGPRTERVKLHVKNNTFDKTNQYDRRHVVQ